MNKQLEDWQQRVVTEADELGSRINRLRDMFRTETFANLHESEKYILRQQIRPMQDYYDILCSRIERFYNPKLAEEDKKSGCFHL